MEAAKRLRERAAQAHRLGSEMTTAEHKTRLLEIARDLSTQADLAEAEEARQASEDS
jgi:hypothetical protein